MCLNIDLWFWLGFNSKRLCYCYLSDRTAICFRWLKRHARICFQMLCVNTCTIYLKCSQNSIPTARYTSFHLHLASLLKWILRWFLGICCLDCHQLIQTAKKTHLFPYNVSTTVLITWWYSTTFTLHWSQQVVGSPEETSRLLLCQATAVVMRQCFNLLGITPVYKLWLAACSINTFNM